MFVDRGWARSLSARRPCLHHAFAIVECVADRRKQGTPDGARTGPARDYKHETPDRFSSLKLQTPTSSVGFF